MGLSLTPFVNSSLAQLVQSVSLTWKRFSVRVRKELQEIINMTKNLKIVTTNHNAEEVKNVLLSKKRKINKFLKLNNDYGDDLPEFVFYSEKHIDDGDYNFKVNGLEFKNSFIRKVSVDKHGFFMYICSRYDVFIETSIEKEINY